MNTPMQHAVTYGAQRIGLGAETVNVEVDVSRGIYAFHIIGLPDKSVHEAQGRVSAAIKHSDYRSPKQQNQKVVVSLAPGELKKTGALFDAPIALAYLLATKQIAFGAEDKLFIGELALDGRVQRAQGILPLIHHAKMSGVKEVYVPKENEKEAALVEGIPLFGFSTLKELIAHLEGKTLLTPIQSTAAEKPIPQTASFASIKGQQSVKRALTIAAAGGHNIALYGPPGTGKTLLAKSVVSILPPLTKKECIEVTALHSIVQAESGDPIWTPPFRSPHHGSSYASVIGGGTPLRPGEISLAHRGVLFLDEFPEFDRRVIESLREPLEERSVTIARASGVAKFPASFMLIIAFNPCPCGNAGTTKICKCAPSAIAAYRRKLTGPIIDRIDMWVSVEASEFAELEQKQPKDDKQTQKCREQVLGARERQRERFGDNAIMLNSEITADTIERYVPASDAALSTLREAAKQLELSPRGYHRALKCAQTIADLGGSDVLTEDHIFEAVGYRHRPSF